MSGNNVFFLIIVSLLIFASSSLIYDAEAYYSEAEQKEIPYVIRDLSVIPNTADSSIMVKIDMENMSTENKGPDKIRFRVYEGWRQEIVLMERKYMLGYDDVSGSGEITIKFSHDLAFGDYLAVIELYEDERNIRINRIPVRIINFLIRQKFITIPPPTTTTSRHNSQ